MAKGAYIGASKEIRTCPECGGNTISPASLGDGLLCLDCMYTGPKSEFITYTSAARKIKKGYIGVNTQVPIKEITQNTYSFSKANIEQYFTITNGSGTSGWTYNDLDASRVKFTPNNLGVNSSTATIELTLKHSLSSTGSYLMTYTTETNYDKVTVKIGSSTVANAVSGNSQTSTQTIATSSLTEGTKIVLTYTKDSSSSASGEHVDFNLTLPNVVATTETITGYETKPVARKIKKVYIGVGGVARPCWSGGELEYYGTATALSETKYILAATTVGNYALFGGGAAGSFSGRSSVVNAYDASLTRSIPTALGTARTKLAATTVGNYALFGGGYASGNSSVVESYNASLTRSTATSLSTIRSELAATTVGNYALFGGGYNSPYIQTAVDAYNTSLTRTTATALAEGRYQLAATAAGNYALFGGGQRSNVTSNADIVDAYDTSLTRTTPTALSAARYQLAATTVGNYALFGGGYTGFSNTTVDAYNASLTRTTATPLSTARHNLAATTVGDYALFGGGYTSTGGAVIAVVNAYDASLTRTTSTPLSTARRELAATTVGNYALFGGGYTGSNNSDVVDVYTVV